MPPQKRASAKAKDSVAVEPASASQPRQATNLSEKKIEAAVEKSAEHLEAQTAPPSDIHVKSATPSKASVEAAVEKSAERLTANGQTVATESRDKTMDAAPVSAGGKNPGLDANPVSATRDKTMDSAPVFTASVLSTPQENKERSEDGSG